MSTALEDAPIDLRLAGCGLVAACSVAVATAEPEVFFPQPQWIPAEVSTAKFAFEVSSGSTLTIRDLKPIPAFEAFAKAEGFQPTGWSVTSDDSKLFEFIGKVKVGVDVYPTGEVVVIVRKDVGTDYFEYHISRLDRILEKLNDVGVPRSV